MIKLWTLRRHFHRWTLRVSSFPNWFHLLACPIWILDDIWITYKYLFVIISIISILASRISNFLSLHYCKTSYPSSQYISVVILSDLISDVVDEDFFIARHEYYIDIRLFLLILVFDWCLFVVWWFYFFLIWSSDGSESWWTHSTLNYLFFGLCNFSVSSWILSILTWFNFSFWFNVKLRFGNYWSTDQFVINNQIFRTKTIVIKESLFKSMQFLWFHGFRRRTSGCWQFHEVWRYWSDSILILMQRQIEIPNCWLTNRKRFTKI